MQLKTLIRRPWVCALFYNDLVFSQIEIQNFFQGHFSLFMITLLWQMLDFYSAFCWLLFLVHF